jgi:hypothetical protein
MKKGNLKTVGFLLAALCLSAFAARAQNSAGAPLSVEAMLADFDTLHRIVRESHPNPYRGVSEAEAEKNWRRVRARIKKPLSERQFLNLLNPVYSQYQDGHTYLDIPLESKDYKAYAEKGGLFFPFGVWETGGRLFVTDSFGAAPLPKGTEIVAVNGRRANEIFRDLAGAMSGDSAANKAATAARLFSLIYWQRFDPGSEFTLRIRRPQSAGAETVKTAGVTAAELENKMFGGKPVDAYELTPRIMVLEVNKMQSTEAVKKFIDETFARVREKNYAALVIDIRRNGGGNSLVGDWVFAQLTRKNYRQGGIKEIRLSPYLTENNKFFREWTARLKNENPVEGDRIVQRSTEADEAGPVDREKWVYEGKVYLLTAPRTYTSGFMMAETFKCYAFGTMVGSAPGSHRNLTGELMRFTLPRSGLQGYVATSHFYPPCYQKTKTDFLAPDANVEQTPEDLAAGRDTVLEYVKRDLEF